jgi:hypothetical protein
MPQVSRRPILPLSLLVACFFASLLRAQDASQDAKVPVTFLALEQARDAIVDDSADPYFEKLTPHEMSAKTGKPITGDTPEAQRAECKSRYQTACEEFTADDRQALITLLSKIHPAVEHTYPLFARQPWSFIKVSGTLEGGMPHTRGPHIILSAPALGALRQMAAAGDAGVTAAAGILVHEQTHVVERLHPKLFTDLFTGVFGFRPTKQIMPDPWLAARQLVNPDGTDTRWIYPLKDDEHPDAKPRWILPLVVFSDPEATSLRQMTFVAFELEPTDANAAAPDTFKLKLDPSGEPARQPLAEVDAYVRAIRTRHSLYHPNEAAADLMARLVIADCLGQPAAADGEEMRPVRAWAAKAFGRPEQATQKP